VSIYIDNTSIIQDVNTYISDFIKYYLDVIAFLLLYLYYLKTSKYIRQNYDRDFDIKQPKDLTR